MGMGYAFTNGARGSAVSIAVLMIILDSEVASALQVESLVLNPSKLQQSRLSMAETSYPFGGFRDNRWESSTSFLAPLFADTDRPRRRGIFSSSSLIVGSSFSFLEESNLYDDEKDDELLSYLPCSSSELAPGTKDLLKRVTSQYVNGNEPAVEVQDVLDVLDDEYRSYDVPMSIGEESFDVTQTGEDIDGDAARILSFAALHRVPRDIAILLLGEDNIEVVDGKEDEYRACREAFARVGWKDVRFEKGLAVRLKRKFVPSASERYAPLPRSWLSSQRQAARNAEAAVTEAAYTVTPARKLLSRAEFLASMDKELSSPSAFGQNSLRDALLFFPRQNRFFKRLKRSLTKQSKLLKQAGLSGLLSYVALSLAWYTLAIVWQWRRTSSTVAISRAALATSLRRFGKVFAAAFLGSQLTRLWRIRISLALTPFGNRALKATQKKFRISEGRAFGLLAGIMVLSSLAVWATIVVGDAAILRTWVIQSVQKQTELLQLDTI